MRQKDIKTFFVLVLAGLFWAGLSGCWGAQRPGPTEGAASDLTGASGEGAERGGEASEEPPQNPDLAAVAAARERQIEAGRSKATTCATCHGANGEGMAGLGFTLAGSNKNYLIGAINEYKSGERDGGPLPTMMKQQAGLLSDQDVNDLAAYFSSLDRPASPVNPSPYQR